MAHKTLVNGTAYEISGGKTLVNGTGYSIASGKTLVGGTAYEVGFGKPVTITLTNSSDYNPNSYSRYARIEYNGIEYNEPMTFEAMVGDTIYCTAHVSSNGTGSSTSIYLNNEQVATTNSDGYTEPDDDNTVTYAYTVEHDANILLDYHTGSWYGGGYSAGSIYITEIPDGQALVTITGNGNATYSYVVIDNITYLKENAVAVKIGTSIRCVAKYAGGLEDGYIQVNGNIVIAAGKKQQTLTYDYTVSKNATIQLVYIASASGETGRIIITEQ